ncbi:MAG: hypothetical protein DRH17_13340 [Deltaproteobacteria bacterium]|nr:MAG: hypothetical protein DRH17_13340 [Deltaproteobacteria bacterium]
MVSIQKLVSITTLGDVEISSGIHVLHGLPEDWIYIGWYHEFNYGSDEYGCTSLPNIFHHWLMKRADIEAGQLTHVNALGRECTDFVGMETTYDPAKKILVIGGYRYTAGDQGYPKIAIIDVSDPSSPRVLKELEHSQSFSSPRARPYYNPKHNILMIGVHPENRIYYDTFENVLNASSIDAIPNRLDGYDWISPVDEDRVLVANPSTGRNDVLDLTTMQTSPTDISGWFIVRAPNYVVALYKTANNTIGVKFFNISDLSLAKDVDTGKSAPSNGEQLSLLAVGDKVVIFNNESLEIYVVDPVNGLEATFSLPEKCGWLDRFSDGVVICTHPFRGNGDIKEFLADVYYAVVVNGTKACIKDQAGNPVTNKTVYVSEPYGQQCSRDVQKLYGLLKSVTQLTTDSEGCVDLSQFVGKTVVIIVPP